MDLARQLKQGISTGNLLFPDVTLHQVNLVNRQLGAACAKPFPVSAVCVLDPGQSELLSLSMNV